MRRQQLFRELALLGVLLALAAYFSLSSEAFFSRDNLANLPRHLAEVGILSCGMTLIIMTGGIDLSVGSLLGLSGIVLGYTWKHLGMAPALIAALAAGFLGGAANGFLITRFALPPLVVTLATMALFRGLALGISQAQPVSNFPEAFAWLGQGEFGPLPAQLLFWAAIAIAAFWLVQRTSLGRFAMAIGDNERAAAYAALPTRRVKFWIYAGTGLLCALAAIIFTSRVATAKADAGEGKELEVITAVVLGGTPITGGRGSIIGTTLGILILGTVRNGLSLIDVSTIWQEVLVGVILITTAAVNSRLVERKRE